MTHALKAAEANHALKAALWMTGAIVSFSTMAVAGRFVRTELDTFEVMLYRSLVGVVLVLLVGGMAGTLGQISRRRMGVQLIRNMFHFTGQNLWFYGVTLIPLAQLVALEFSSPIWVAVLAPLLLGEIMTRSKLIGALIGFLGVLIVARPGIAPLETGHFAGLGAAIGFAMSLLFTRKLRRTDTTLCVLFWMTASQTVMGFAIAAVFGLSLFSLPMLPWIIVVGIAGLSAHFCLTSALGHAPASIVSPMEFARLPLIAVVGMIIYGEPLEVFVFLGGAVILAGNLYNIRGERRARRAGAVAG